MHLLSKMGSPTSSCVTLSPWARKRMVVGEEESSWESLGEIWVGCGQYPQDESAHPFWAHPPGSAMRELPKRSRLRTGTGSVGLGLGVVCHPLTHSSLYSSNPGCPLLSWCFWLGREPCRWFSPFLPASNFPSLSKQAPPYLFHLICLFLAMTAGDQDVYAL